MLTVGNENKTNKTLLTWSIIYTARLCLKPSRKLDKAATVTLLNLERSAKAIKDPYIHSHSGVMSFSRPGIPSPLRLPTKGFLWPRRTSQHISSLSESYTILFLCFWWSLMLIYCYLLPPNISWNCQWVALKCWKWAKSTFSEVKCLLFRGGLENGVAEGKVQLYFSAVFAILSINHHPVTY